MEGAVGSTIIDQSETVQAVAAQKLAVLADVEETIARVSVYRCDEMLMHIIDLFVASAPRLSQDEVDFFDDVIGRLALATDCSAKSMLARRLAPLANSPAKVTRMLANDDEITVASPILIESDCLDEDVLLLSARTKGPEHLLAIAQRKSLNDLVALALVERGDNKVLRLVADNPDIKLTEAAFSRMIECCQGDDELAAKVGARPDIPHQQFQKLLGGASPAVRSKFDAVNLSVRVEFSSVEPHFVFVGNGQSMLAA
jgi:Uncharacterised protein conserved in bacteria (DUF2336)